MKKVIIIGAGLTGITLAEKLKSNFDVQILEKSRGVGGRMATRRSDDSERKFDHGAQFFKTKENINPYEHELLMKGKLSPWFKDENRTMYKSDLGFSGFAKELIKDLNISLNIKITKIEKIGSRLKLTAENQSIYETDLLIITAPLPQALELLKTNQIPFPKNLSEIDYAKAILGLFEVNRSQLLNGSPSGYLNINENGISYIVDNKKKGVSKEEAWTVVMDQEFSETHYEYTDEKNLSVITEKIKQLDSQFSFSSAQLKKWRYSHPLENKKIEKDLFHFDENYKILLAGDGFGGGSLNGALRSAHAAYKKILGL